MQTTNQPLFWRRNLYPILLTLALGTYGIFYFIRALTPDWIPTGDTPNHLGQFAYLFSGFARGEFPLWNPTLLTGEHTIIRHAIVIGGPLANLIALLSVKLGITDIVLSFSVYLYVLIVLYVSGTYLFVLSLSNNHAPAYFASLIALFSSPIFWSANQCAYLLVIYSVPWILYSSTLYFKNYELRYLLYLILAICSALYSYEFVIPLSFLIFFACTSFGFYYKNIDLKILKNIPTGHIVFLLVTLTLVTLPQALTYFDIKNGNFLPSLSRVEGNEFEITNEYTIKYKEANQRTNSSQNFLTCENCLVSLFTGVYFKPIKQTDEMMWSTLRYYIGPIAFQFILVSLFSFSKRALCFFTAGISSTLFAGGVFPFNLISKLPVFSLVHNVDITNHYFLFILIILSGLGFNSFISQKPDFNLNIFKWASTFLLLGSLISPILFLLLFSQKAYFYFGGNEDYINYSLAIVVLSMLALLLSQHYKIKSFFSSTTSILLITIVVGFLGNYLILSKHDFFNGQITTDPNLASLKNRTNHFFKFKHTRPDQPEVSTQPYNYPTLTKKLYYDYLATSYSNSSMRDNSYNSFIRESGFPPPKRHVKFRKIFNSELFLRDKFFFLPRVFISKKENDMGIFISQPNLLSMFFNHGIGVADFANKNISLGILNNDNLASLNEIITRPNFDVDIIEYKANSMTFIVSSIEPGMFVYTDLWHKDWHVEVDQNSVPLRKIFHTFKGVELEPGTHEVRFIFRSTIGYFLILANLIFFLLLIFTIVTTLHKKNAFKLDGVYSNKSKKVVLP